MFALPGLVVLTGTLCTATRVVFVEKKCADILVSLLLLLNLML